MLGPIEAISNWRNWKSKMSEPSDNTDDLDDPKLAYRLVTSEFLRPLIANRAQDESDVSFETIDIINSVIVLMEDETQELRDEFAVEMRKLLKFFIQRMQGKAQRSTRMLTANFRDTILTAIDSLSKSEKARGYKWDSTFVEGLKHVLQAVERGDRITIEDK